MNGFVGLSAGIFQSLIENPIVVAIFKIAVVMGVILLGIPLLIWMERKVIADAQARIGPNRVGPYGLLQPFADGIKLLFKEEITPAGVDKAVYVVAPVVSIIPALSVYAVIPFGGLRPGSGTAIADQVNIGLLFALATMSLAVYGIVLAGWASNSKYSLLGGLRSSAQMISYELSLGLSLVGVLMLAGTLNLVEVVRAQSVPLIPGFPYILNWFIFKQPLGFLIYLISAFAESARIPFDLPEAEGELGAGFHTEYSSMKFAMFFMGEYAFVGAHSALATTLFFGGWNGLLPLSLGTPVVPGVLWYLAKVILFIFFFMWVRATLPRFRYDQLMSFGWKVLLPGALINVFLTGVGIILTQAWVGG